MSIGFKCFTTETKASGVPNEIDRFLCAFFSSTHRNKLLLDFSVPPVEAMAAGHKISWPDMSIGFECYPHEARARGRPTYMDCCLRAFLSSTHRNKFLLGFSVPTIEARVRGRLFL